MFTTQKNYPHTFLFDCYLLFFYYTHFLIHSLSQLSIILFLFLWFGLFFCGSFNRLDECFEYIFIVYFFSEYLFLPKFKRHNKTFWDEVNFRTAWWDACVHAKGIWTIFFLEMPRSWNMSIYLMNAVWIIWWQAFMMRKSDAYMRIKRFQLHGHGHQISNI